MAVLVSLIARSASSIVVWLPWSIGFGDEQNGAAIVRAADAQQVHGKLQAVENGRSLVSGIEIVQRRANLHPRIRK
jgi:hypothetical protein